MIGAAVNAFSMRLCGASGGKINVMLSPQDALSCYDNDGKFGFGCSGGDEYMLYGQIDAANASNTSPNPSSKSLVSSMCSPYVGKDASTLDAQGNGPKGVKCGDHCTDM